MTDQLKRYVFFTVRDVGFKGTKIKRIVNGISKTRLSKEVALRMLKEDHAYGSHVDPMTKDSVELPPEDLIVVRLPDKERYARFFIEAAAAIKTWPAKFSCNCILLLNKNLDTLHYNVIGVFERVKDMEPYVTPHSLKLILIHKLDRQFFVCDEPNDNLTENDLWDMDRLRSI